MRTKSELKPEGDKASVRVSVLSLLASMADTTWRMFTPPAALVAGGLWADLHWHTKPWLTVTGLVLGLGGSVMLVRAQLKEAQ